jgi:amino acid transporter
VHARFHTPHLAIFVHALLITALAVTSSFTYLALLSNVGLLTLYFLGCAAALRFVSRPAAADAPGLRLPGERLIPVAAMAVNVWILAHATQRELLVLGGTLATAALLFLVRRARK